MRANIGKAGPGIDQPIAMMTDSKIQRRNGVRVDFKWRLDKVALLQIAAPA